MASFQDPKKSSRFYGGGDPPHPPPHVGKPCHPESGGAKFFPKNWFWVGRMVVGNQVEFSIWVWHKFVGGAFAFLDLCAFADGPIESVPLVGWLVRSKSRNRLSWFLIFFAQSFFTIMAQNWLSPISQKKIWFGFFLQKTAKNYGFLALYFRKPTIFWIYGYWNLYGYWKTLSRPTSTEKMREIVRPVF